MTVSTNNVIGVALSNVDSSPVFNVGTSVDLDNGGRAVYVSALSDIPQYSAVSVKADNSAVPLTTTNSAASKRVAFAQTSIAVGNYGWVVTGSPVTVNLAASCQPSVPLYTTATGGVLDDAAVSGGLVLGVVATTSVVTAGPAAAVAAAVVVIGTGTVGQ